MMLLLSNGRGKLGLLASRVVQNGKQREIKEKSKSNMRRTTHNEEYSKDVMNEALFQRGNHKPLTKPHRQIHS